MLCTNAESLLPAGNPNAPTLVNVSASVGDQSSLENVSVAPLKRSSRGSAIAPVRPNAASAGPAARTRILRGPSATTTPTINVWPAPIAVRTERLESRAVGPTGTGAFTASDTGSLSTEPFALV